MKVKCISIRVPTHHFKWERGREGAKDKAKHCISKQLWPIITIFCRALLKGQTTCLPNWPDWWEKCVSMIAQKKEATSQPPKLQPTQKNPLCPPKAREIIKFPQGPKKNPGGGGLCIWLGCSSWQLSGQGDALPQLRKMPIRGPWIAEGSVDGAVSSLLNIFMCK